MNHEKDERDEKKCLDLFFLSAFAPLRETCIELISRKGAKAQRKYKR
jgi:hypothetical protein